MENKPKSSRKEPARRDSCRFTGTPSSDSSNNSTTSTRRQSPRFASSTPTSAQSTPKKVLRKKDNANKTEHFSPSSSYDFVISGSPAPRISDRANSLPSARPRRPFVVKPGSDETVIKSPKVLEVDNMSLDDLTSIASDLDEITSSKCDSLFHQRFALPQSTYRKESIDRTNVLRSRPSSGNSTRILGKATEINEKQSYSARIHVDDIQTRSFKDLSVRRLSMSHVTRDMCSISPEYTPSQSSIDIFQSRSSIYIMDATVDSVSNNSAVQSDLAIHSPSSQRSQFTDVTFATSSSSRTSSTEDCQISTEDSNTRSTSSEVCGIDLLDTGELNHLCYDDSSIRVQINESYEERPTLCDKYLAKDGAEKPSCKPDSAITNLSEHLSKAQLGLQKGDGFTLTRNEMREILNSANTLTHVISSALERFSRNDEETKKREDYASTDRTLEDVGRDSELSHPEEVKSDSGLSIETTQTDILLPNTEYASKDYENIQ